MREGNTKGFHVGDAKVKNNYVQPSGYKHEYTNQKEGDVVMQIIPLLKVFRCRPLKVKLQLG